MILRSRHRTKMGRSRMRQIKINKGRKRKVTRQETSKTRKEKKKEMETNKVMIKTSKMTNRTTSRMTSQTTNPRISKMAMAQEMASPIRIIHQKKMTKMRLLQKIKKIQVNKMISKEKMIKRMMRKKKNKETMATTRKMTEPRVKKIKSKTRTIN